MKKFLAVSGLAYALALLLAPASWGEVATPVKKPALPAKFDLNDVGAVTPIK